MEGVNLYVVGIFHTRSLSLSALMSRGPPCSPHSPSPTQPSNSLRVAPLCAPAIRCNEKCFEMGLAYHAMLIEHVLEESAVL